MRKFGAHIDGKKWPSTYEQDKAADEILPHVRAIPNDVGGTDAIITNLYDIILDR